MATKKKIVEDFEAGKSVPIQELVKAIDEPEAPKGELIAAAPFAYRPFPGSPEIEVQAGDVFTPPAGWTREPQHEEFMKANKEKQGRPVDPGVVFTYQGEIVNPGEKNPALRERREHRVILPLKES
jgi:hypothetical protein